MFQSLKPSDEVEDLGQRSNPLIRTARRIITSVIYTFGFFFSPRFPWRLVAIFASIGVPPSLFLLAPSQSSPPTAPPHSCDNPPIFYVGTVKSLFPLFSAFGTRMILEFRRVHAVAWLSILRLRSTSHSVREPPNTKIPSRLRIPESS